MKRPQMAILETTSKVSLELATRMNLGRRSARAKLSMLDIVHQPLHSPEKVIRKWKRAHGSPKCR